jgi:hypothetical protein
MKLEYTEQGRKSLLETYKDFLQQNVEAFSKEEISVVSQVYNKCIQEINVLKPGLLPDSIFLVKVIGEAYGESVYYTRENSIIIPKDALVQNQLSNEEFEQSLYMVCLHELFHVISRYSPDLSAQLYQLIGFQKLNAKLVLPTKLRQVQLLNPDGVDIAYAIRLYHQETHESKLAIPIIVSRHDAYSSKFPDFFRYLDFNLYELEQNGEAMYSVLCDENGKSTLAPSWLKSFSDQIKDNTNYIIHPDEIMADNFMFLVHNSNTEEPMEFSEEGSKLQDRIYETILNYK